MFYGIKRYPFALNSRWYQATVEIDSFSHEELFATKLRALLQRRKNRDLFDLQVGLQHLSMGPTRIVACFEHYLTLDGRPISRAVAEQRMLEKLSCNLEEDIAPLLLAGVDFSGANAIEAFKVIWRSLITRISGEPWKLTDEVVAELRETRYPNLALYG